MMTPRPNVRQFQNLARTVHSGKDGTRPLGDQYRLRRRDRMLFFDEECSATFFVPDFLDPREVVDGLSNKLSQSFINKVTMTCTSHVWI